MSTQNIKAGEAYVLLSLRDASFRKGLAAASASLKSWGRGIALFGTTITGIGSAVAAPLLAMANSFANAGSELYDMSQRTAMSVEQLQLLKYAAEQTGTSIGVIEKAALKARKSGKNFEYLAAQVASVEDPAKQLQKSIELFGTKVGPAITPLLRDLPALRARFKELGIGISTDAAQRADELGDNLGDLRYVAKSASDSIGSALAPALNSAVKFLTNVVIRVRDWVSENGNLFNSLVQIAGVTVAAGAATAAVGVGMEFVGYATGIFNDSLGFMVTALHVALSPLGLVAAAVAGLAYWFVTTTEWGQEMVREVSSGFRGLKEVAVEAFGGISDALASGDLALAAKVAWAGISLAWAEGTDDLKSSWIDFKHFFIAETTGLVFDVQEAWVNAIAYITKNISDLHYNAKQGFDLVGTLLTMPLGDKQGQADALRGWLGRAVERESAFNGASADMELERARELASIEAARGQAAADRLHHWDKEQKAREQSLKTAQDELLTLREQAKASREEMETKSAKAFDPGKFNLNPVTNREQVFGSFSASALSRQGGPTAGVDPGSNAIIKAMEKHEKQAAEREWRYLQRLAQMMGGLNP